MLCIFWLFNIARFWCYSKCRAFDLVCQVFRFLKFSEASRRCRAYLHESLGSPGSLGSPELDIFNGYPNQDRPGNKVNKYQQISMRIEVWFKYCP